MIVLAVKISLIAYMFVALGEPEMIFAPYQKLIANLPEWLNKPLGGCGYCFCGQFAMWYYIFTQKFNLIEFLFFLSLSIFLIKIYDIIWNYDQ